MGRTPWSAAGRLFCAQSIERLNKANMAQLPGVVPIVVERTLVRLCQGKRNSGRRGRRLPSKGDRPTLESQTFYFTVTVAPICVDEAPIVINTGTLTPFVLPAGAIALICNSPINPPGTTPA